MSADIMSQWIGIFILALIAAIGALWVSGSLLLRRKSPDIFEHACTHGHFLFDKHVLTDHDIKDVPENDTEFADIENWADLRSWLSFRFANLPDTLVSIPEGKTTRYSEAGGAENTFLELLRSGETTRITLSDNVIHSAAAWHSALKSIQTDTDATAILKAVPQPIWCTDLDGTLIWKNAASAVILENENAQQNLDQLRANAESDTELRLVIPSETPETNRWFGIKINRFQNQLIHFGADITPIVQAETAQRQFVQTLTKTFANLTTGLAVFDKSCQLALFNPALVDLTNVSASFLSAKPDLMDFFDQLRERQVLPEPKNYANWRAQIRDVLAQANDGLYQDTWTLPTGLTYRVTGRPHPDGAVAFLFEDISAEISLTRRFRTQIDLRQSVLDGLSEAVAVIAPNDILIFCNQACNHLLGIDPDSSFADMSLRDLLKICSEQLDRYPEWQAFKKALLAGNGAQSYETVLTSGNSTIMRCSIKPLTGGNKALSLMPLSQVTQDKGVQIAS